MLCSRTVYVCFSLSPLEMGNEDENKGEVNEKETKRERKEEEKMRM